MATDLNGAHKSNMSQEPMQCFQRYGNQAEEYIAPPHSNADHMSLLLCMLGPMRYAKNNDNKPNNNSNNNNYKPNNNNNNNNNTNACRRRLGVVGCGRELVRGVGCGRELVSPEDDAQCFQTTHQSHTDSFLIQWPPTPILP
jgi:hypothetical protein